jgi:cation:H+ antiporter
VDGILIAYLVGGAVLLVVGAESLVRGASRLALAMGITPIAIGLTVVAFGTSAPELAVSVRGALTGAGDVAVGNVVGSNLFNLLGVLGISASVAPGGLPVADTMLRTDLPLSLMSTLVVLPCLVTGLVILRWEGALLLVSYGGYLVVVITTGLGHPHADVATPALFVLLALVATTVTAVGWRLAGSTQAATSG